MSYTAPYFDDSGLVIPSYTDIRDALLEEATSIFGPDVYLETDSADYQLISVCSLKMFDCLSAIQLAYNNRGPQTATGAGLDGIVLLNGISRLPATYSTCQVLITGTAGTIITSGVVKDTANLLWDLPSKVEIPAGGTVEVTATCQTIGAVEAAVGAIKYINTPTAGWTSVTNLVQAVAGKAQETDAALRSRQAVSVATPSQTMLQGTKAAILAVPNVTRCEVYENDTNISSSEGFPAHSITCVVEGGADYNVAEAILYHKGIGGYTNGTTIQTVTDSDEVPYQIRFYRPSYVPIYMQVTISRLQGYETSLAENIKVSLVEYLNNLSLGSDITISALWGVVMSNMPDLRTPVFTVTTLQAGLNAGALNVNDIVLSFNSASQASSSTINITVL